MNNPWQLCETNPPPEYTRVEIKDKDKKHYIGYRYKYTYYETYGNWVIESPKYWRWVPQQSTLLANLKEKLRIELSNMEVANEGKNICNNCR